MKKILYRGDADFWGSKITSLGQLQYVGGGAGLQQKYHLTNTPTWGIIMSVVIIFYFIYRNENIYSNVRERT